VIHIHYLDLSGCDSTEPGSSVPAALGKERKNTEGDREFDSQQDPLPTILAACKTGIVITHSLAIEGLTLAAFLSGRPLIGL
jgi:hypothetical protein